MSPDTREPETPAELVQAYITTNRLSVYIDRELSQVPAFADWDVRKLVSSAHVVLNGQIIEVDIMSTREISTHLFYPSSNISQLAALVYEHPEDALWGVQLVDDHPFYPHPASAPAVDFLLDIAQAK